MLGISYSNILLYNLIFFTYKELTLYLLGGNTALNTHILQDKFKIWGEKKTCWQPIPLKGEI